MMKTQLILGLTLQLLLTTGCGSSDSSSDSAAAGGRRAVGGTTGSDGGAVAAGAAGTDIAAAGSSSTRTGINTGGSIASGGASASTAPTLETGEMASIPAGAFQMGHAAGNADELPVHTVSVDAFELDVTEVTVLAYRQCVNAGICTAASTTHEACNGVLSTVDNHPVNCVDWNQATTYCDWAGKRLPTEEEWEYAARGTASLTFPWGEQAADDTRLCWSGSGVTRTTTCPVGQFPAGASPFGILDMAGNVFEWTSSQYSLDYTSALLSDYRVLRGVGNWFAETLAPAAAANRARTTPISQGEGVGFRCAR